MRPLTDLVRQTRCNPQEVVDNVSSHVRRGLLIEIGWMETLFDKAEFKREHLELMYRAIAKRIKQGELNSDIEKSYYEVLDFIRKRYD